MEYPVYSQPCPTIFGTGAVNLVGEKAKGFGIKKAMLVTDAGLVKAGVAERVEKLLKDAGIEVYVYDRVEPNPIDYQVEEGGEVARREKVDGIIGLGGGSSLDTAKSICILCSNPAPLKQWWRRTDYKKELPLILIPTTAGTGSENTIYSVVTDSVVGNKEVTLINGDLAICDPELTYKCPESQTVPTGMDAFAHAAEAMTVRQSNPATRIFSLDAISRIVKYLPIVVADPSNKEARENMMLAANFAGIAISNSSCHVGHASGSGIGAKLHVPHGLACAWTLPEAMRYAARSKIKEVKEIADVIGIEYSDSDSNDVIGDKVADFIYAFCRKVNLKSMAASGFTKEQIVDCADLIMIDPAWDCLPSPLTKEELEEMLGRMYDSYK